MFDNIYVFFFQSNIVNEIKNNQSLFVGIDNKKKKKLSTLLIMIDIVDSIVVVTHNMFTSSVVVSHQ